MSRGGWMGDEVGLRLEASKVMLWPGRKRRPSKGERMNSGGNAASPCHTHGNCIAWTESEGKCVQVCTWTCAREINSSEERRIDGPSSMGNGPNSSRFPADGLYMYGERRVTHKQKTTRKATYTQTAQCIFPSRESRGCVTTHSTHSYLLPGSVVFRNPCAFSTQQSRLPAKPHECYCPNYPPRAH
ncbi:hypothetical protein BCR44DRAFT_341212 [Catenaria anguillulae PL171]|uniref:Uncharacterized protein n=1 Tax=Catenaria anguillulae PL171 TaxID=765915 RepID=A0A1Y2I817_9FUNG|nr:hypothetical protein BCR44DRAFT_341212 [Catenaria anguillulae PL171]